MNVSFCTCTDLACPLHPSNHEKGCTPCSAKNLQDKEIPSCFFRAVGYPKPTKDWYFEDFAALMNAKAEAEKADE